MTVNVPLPKGIKSKDLIVVMDRRKLKVGAWVLGGRLKRAQVQVKGTPEPIMEGELFEDIAKDDSSWTIGWWTGGGMF